MPLTKMLVGQRADAITLPLVIDRELGEAYALVPHGATYEQLRDLIVRAEREGVFFDDEDIDLQEEIPLGMKYYGMFIEEVIPDRHYET